MKRLYFAYGSNMAAQQMSARCPGARALGPARLDGWRFYVNRRGTASIKPAMNHAVFGVVWRIGPDHKTTLDHYEGIRLRRYLTREISLDHDAGAKRGFTYVGTHLGEGRPVRAYLQGVVIPAARDWGLPAHYLDELESWFAAPAIGPARPRAPGRSWKP